MSKLTQSIKQDKMERIAGLLVTQRIPEGEKNTLKTVFSEDPAVYKILRDLFFGFDLNDDEKRIVANFKIIKPLLRKVFLPTLTKDIPLGQNFDLWQTQDIKTATAESFDTVFSSKVILLDLLETAFKRLDDPDDNHVDLSIKKDLPSLVARNNYISYVDNQVRFLIQFVNMDSLTPEEQLKMMQLNSSK